MNTLRRIHGIWLKEWQLNFRFPVGYLATNLISPLKSAVLMSLIYRGFFNGGIHGLGDLRKENYEVFVLLGTTCHALFSTSMSGFADRMVSEKWWQTVLATLISPASALEMIAGCMLGSVANLAIAQGILLVITLVYPVSFLSFVVGSILLFLLAASGFGIGLLGATVRLCFEGYAWIYDYGIQGLIFFSCFYYPIEMIPGPFRWIPQCLPSFHMANLIHHVYLDGMSAAVIPSLVALTGAAIALLVLPALLFDYSIRRFGIVGY